MYACVCASLIAYWSVFEIRDKIEAIFRFATLAFTILFFFLRILIPNLITFVVVKEEGEVMGFVV